MSEVGIKKDVAVSLFISCGLSVIKGFKYTVNYDSLETSFPIPNQFDIFNPVIDKPSFLEAFFIVNFTSDIFNYTVFVIICLIIHIFMVLKLRAVLEEKKKSLVFLNVLDLFINVNDFREQNRDSEKVISRGIKVIILYTVINFLFKIPSIFLPTVNLYAQFYNKKEIRLYEKPEFKEFYMWLINSGFFVMFEDLLNLLFFFTISIQLFVYRRFDDFLFKGDCKNKPLEK